MRWQLPEWRPVTHHFKRERKLEPNNITNFNLYLSFYHPCSATQRYIKYKLKSLKWNERPISLYLIEFTDKCPANNLKKRQLNKFGTECYKAQIQPPNINCSEKTRVLSEKKTDVKLILLAVIQPFRWHLSSRMCNDRIKF